MNTLLHNIALHATQIMQVLVFVTGCYFFSISVFGWIERKDDT